MTRLRHQTRAALLLFLGFSLLYVAISRGVFLYGDDILMFQVTEGLVERGGPAVTSPSDEADVARSIPGRDGKNYAKYGIGQSLVAIPAYVVSDIVVRPLLPLVEIHDAHGNLRTGTQVWGVGLTSAVAGGATVALTFLLALAAGYSQRTAYVLAALLGGATLLAHYSATFLSEPLSALCLVLVVYGLLRASSAAEPQRWLWLSGFAAGFGIAVKVASGVTLLAPGLWLLWLAWQRRRAWRRAVLMLVAWGTPIAGWLALVAAYNWVRFGAVTETGYGGEARQYTTPFLTGVEGLLISPGKGVLWYSPPLFLALTGSWWFARRKPALALVIFGVVAATVTLYARYYQWYGGGVWGTRFLVPVLPLLLLPAGEIIERARRGNRAAVAGVAAAALLGVYVTILGIAVPFDRYIAEASVSPEAWDAALWKIDASPLVIHARRLDDDLTDPDIAAVRYDSTRLLAVSASTSLLGLVAVVGGYLTLPPHSREERRALRE